jgi:hypothetical protein
MQPEHYLYLSRLEGTEAKRIVIGENQILIISSQTT